MLDDNNNNVDNDSKIKFCMTGKKYDSGLEILSPQSNESLDICTYKHTDSTAIYELTKSLHSTNLDVNANHLSTQGEQTRNILELRNSDDLGRFSNTVIYKNDSGSTRCLKITDVLIDNNNNDHIMTDGNHLKLIKTRRSVKRSNTFSHTTPQIFDRQSIDDIVFAFHSNENLHSNSSPHVIKRNRIFTNNKNKTTANNINLPKQDSFESTISYQDICTSSDSNSSSCTNSIKYKFKRKFMSFFQCLYLYNKSKKVHEDKTSFFQRQQFDDSFAFTTPSTVFTDFNNNTIRNSSSSIVEESEDDDIYEDEIESAENDPDVFEEEDNEDVEFTDNIVDIQDMTVITEIWRLSFDQFDNVEYLNSGAEGVVYKADYERRQVAMKTFANNYSDKEIKVLLQLDHPNIVKFLGTCQNDKKNYLVMEYCPGGELYQLLSRNDYEITYQTALSWARQICEGMAYLHSKDIIHRDLKSPNVLMSDNGRLKIIDFGFGKSCNETKFLNSFVGTFAWMAPEIIRKEGYTKKVDVWSYGVLIWELLTRKIPYFGVESYAIIYGVGDSSLTLPIPETFPNNIISFLNLCWSREPDQRPSFDQILGEFNKHFIELQSLDLVKCQKQWSSVIDKEFDTVIRSQISSSKMEEELIRKRTKELNEAKGIKRHYNDKLIRTDQLITLLMKCLDTVKIEKLKNEKESKLIQCWKRFMKNKMTEDLEKEFLESLQRGSSNNILPEALEIYQSSNKHSYKRRKRVKECYSVVEPIYSSGNFYSKNSTHLNILSSNIPRKHSMPTNKYRGYHDNNGKRNPIITVNNYAESTTAPIAIKTQRYISKSSKIISSSCSEIGAAQNNLSSSTEHSIPQKRGKKVKRAATSIKDSHVSSYQFQQYFPQLRNKQSTGGQPIVARNNRIIIEYSNLGNTNPTFKDSVGSLALNPSNFNAAAPVNNNKKKTTTFNFDVVCDDVHSFPLPSTTTANFNIKNTAINNHQYYHQDDNRNSIILQSSIMTDSIDEHPQQLSDELLSSTTSPEMSNPVQIRDKSGRQNLMASSNTEYKDSLDDNSFSGYKPNMIDSLLEKEKKVRNLIMEDEKLSKMNHESKTKSYCIQNVFNGYNYHPKELNSTKSDIENGNVNWE